MEIGKILSVVIPVFNQKERLIITVTQLLRQTVEKKDYEIIIVDDGSTDGLKDDIGELLVNNWCDYNIYYYFKPNEGRAAARNTGISKAAGKYIVFCDADRFPNESYLENHLKAHDDKHLAIIGCVKEYYGPTSLLESKETVNWGKIDRYSKINQYHNKITKIYQDQQRTDSEISWASFMVGNSSLEKETLMRVKGFNQEFRNWGLEHFELALRLKEDGVNIKYCKNAVNYHMPHKRDKNVLKIQIKDSIKKMMNRYGEKVLLLQQYLFGEISLEEFETKYSSGKKTVTTDNYYKF